MASTDKNTREFWSNIIQTKTLRAYTNSDIVGVQVGGSVKNVLAIAAGIANGLRLWSKHSSGFDYKGAS